MTENLVYGLVQVTNGMGRPAMIIDSDGVLQWFEPGDFRFIDMALPPEAKGERHE